VSDLASRAALPADEVGTPALCIRSLAGDRAVPVLYELIAESIEVGSADDNDIVLAGPGVAPHHLAIRYMEGEYCLFINLTMVGEQDWLKPRPGDTCLCPRHGESKPQKGLLECPLCRGRKGSFWLIRPLKPGDTFHIGQALAATYIIQPSEVADAGRQDGGTAPWPALPPALRPVTRVAAPLLATRPYPTADSNLWRWQPPQAPFPIFLHQRVNQAVTAHARQGGNREVGGVLLGSVFLEPESKQSYIVITHSIPAEFAAEGRGHITFTRETWLKIHQIRERKYPTKEIVGWYHTHPGLKIFLSELDLFIHRNFFREPWQVALVIDPAEDKGGFFTWAQGEILSPKAPGEPFTLADLDDGRSRGERPRLRIKFLT
jgi:proteasome lid subunit RPN8/RPN11